MPSRLKSIRFPEEWVEWEAMARLKGMKFNKYVVMAVRGQYELDKAESQERADAIAEREVLQQMAFPDQGEKCTHVQKGQFCYQCNQTRW